MFRLPLSVMAAGLLLLTTAIPMGLGCRGNNAALDGQTGPPSVSVATPIERQITDYAQFTGRTEAVNAVDIKSRVTGYLLETPFKEGAVVKEGEKLFKIDPRQYQAELDAAQGQLEAAQARYALAKTENERAKSLAKENPAAISQKALDQHQAAEDSAKADVEAASSQMEVYKLNVEFTDVISPITGRVGRYEVTIGNLVTENATSLTTVVSQDPIYVYFNIDEQTMLQALRGIYAGELPPPSSRKVPVHLGLQDDQGFPHQGTIDFANNVVDPSTGTLTMRADFKNPISDKIPDKDAAVRMFLPGMFVRVRLPLGKPHDGVLVIDRAVGTDQGQKYLYVIDDQDTVQYRRVTLGPLEDDGLRVIKTGLKAGERVLIDGLQLVKPQTKVKPQEIPMPTTGATPSSDSSQQDGTRSNDAAKTPDAESN